VEMNKLLAGIILGAVAGCIDVIPMLMQKLTWDANLSAFSLWIVVGFLISTSSLRINSFLKGIVIAFLVLIPCAFIIGWHQPASLIPITLMTLILGSFLGWAVDRFGK